MLTRKDRKINCLKYKNDLHKFKGPENSGKSENSKIKGPLKCSPYSQQTFQKSVVATLYSVSCRASTLLAVLKNLVKFTL